MKKFDGYKSEPRANAVPMLPAGVYVAGVKAVKIEGQEPDQQLVLRLDIVEGEWAGYFTKRWNQDSSAQNPRFEPRYKGDFRIQIPDRANQKRQHPEWDERAFNNAMWCFENGNPGFAWAWDEKSLVGKFIGINVREGQFNGNLFTKIGRLESAAEVRDGKVKAMKPLEPRYSDDFNQGDSGSSAGFTPVEEEIPF